MDPFLVFDRVSYKHPDKGEHLPPALKDISLTISHGEWVAIIGANGSGKTTFARHCNGLLQPTSGKVTISGLDTKEIKNLPQIRSKVGLVFQNPEDQMVATLVEEDVAFGPENLCVQPKEIRQRVNESLIAVDMLDNRLRAPHLLSAGQMQRVALAGVLAMQPNCIIFDETTAMLDPMGRSEVISQVRSLKERGFTVLFITHFMEEAFLADRVIVLQKGNLVFDDKPVKLFTDPKSLQKFNLEQPASRWLTLSLQKILRIPPDSNLDYDRFLSLLPAYSGIPKHNLKKQVLQKQSQSNLINANGLGYTYLKDTPLAQLALDNVTFNVLNRSPHGIVGATGSGKSTLLQHMNGLYLPQVGTLNVGPFNLNDPLLDTKALRRFAGLVFQNPEFYFFEQYVGDEIAFGPKLLYGKDDLKERVQIAMSRVGLDFDQFKDRVTHSLSGGEKRKVALASILAIQPGLLILDEPTAGLDPVARQNFISNLKEMHSNGVELLVTSHNMNDLAVLTKSLTVMSKGTTIATGATGEIFSDTDLLKSTSLEQPVAAKAATVLREKGWPIPLNTIIIDDLLESVKSLATKCVEQ